MSVRTCLHRRWRLLMLMIHWVCSIFFYICVCVSVPVCLLRFEVSSPWKLSPDKKEIKRFKEREREREKERERNWWRNLLLAMPIDAALASEFATDSNAAWKPAAIDLSRGRTKSRKRPDKKHQKEWGSAHELERQTEIKETWRHSKREIII